MTAEAIAARLEARSARALAGAVSRAVRDGALGAGERLPPIRTLATELGMSPTTVSAAWGLLARAGTIRTDGRRGTVVAGPNGPAAGRYRRALEPPSPSRFRLDLSSGVPDPALLPDLGPALRRLDGRAAPSSYLDDPVLPALRTALAADWPAPVDHLLVTDGAMDALDLFTRAHLGFGDRVAVEQPSFPPLLDLLARAGVEVLPVPLDADGPCPGPLRDALDAGARAVFLQPRAHNPTGVSIAPARADELVAIVRDRDAVIVEDDSAGAVAQAAPLSLAAALPDRVVHVRSFSKSHGPDLRIAALSGPEDLVAPIAELRLLGQGWTSRVLQALLHDILTDADSIAQVACARAEYARRRSAVVDALRARGVEVVGTDGFNLWLPVADEAAAMVALAAEGIRVAAGAPFCVDPGSRPHVRVTVGLVADRHDLLAESLARASGTVAWDTGRP